MAVPGARARVARAGRIYVEGRHDAELVEKVWGDDLRIEGVVVEYLGGVDDLADHLRHFKPGPRGKVRRLPRRSSRVTVSRSRSTATTSPHQSVVTSSTTMPGSAGVSTARPRFGTFQSPASTSVP